MRKYFLAVMRFPMTRIIIGFVWVALVAFGFQLMLYKARLGLGYNLTKPPGIGFEWLSALITVLGATFAYWSFVRVIERRPVSELGLRGAAREFGAGMVVGGGLMTIAIGSLAAVGAYRVVGGDGWMGPVAAAAILLAPSYLEEVLTRAILFRITEEGLGTWIALVISSAFFGFAHMMNEGASVISSLSIAVEAGVLLGAGYMLTRRLWFVWGLHFAWNVVQGGVFGAAVSGTTVPGWLRSEATGADWLTGGKFGPEDSVLTFAICTAAGVALVFRAARLGHVTPPFWARRNVSPACLDGVDTVTVESKPETISDENV